MIWPWQRSIQTRLMVLVGGLLFTVLTVVNAGMSYLLTEAELEESANHLQIQALVAARNLQDPLSSYYGELEYLEDDDHDEHDDHNDHRGEGDGSANPASRLPGWTDSLTLSTGAQVLVSDLEGRVLAGERAPLHPQELAAAQSSQPIHRWTESRIFATAPILGRRGDPIGLVRLAIPRSEAAARSASMSLALVLASSAALMLGMLAAHSLSRRLVRPLKQLEERAHLAARGDWTTPVEVVGQDELASLSRAFAAMLSELQSMWDRQQRFVSHASHEFRTPLTRIKLRTEALANGALQEPEVAQKFVDELDREVDRLASLTDTLLSLGRLEERATLRVEDPLPVMKRAVLRWEPESLRRGLRLQSELPEELPSLALPTGALDTVIDNLLANAVKYTPEGGEIVAKASCDEAMVVFTVHNSGPGISADHLPHVFERFYRADPTRGSQGFGLGLALVRAAVEAAGGEVSVQSSAGQGATFTVRLRRAEELPPTSTKGSPR